MLSKYKGRFIKIYLTDDSQELGTMIDCDKDWVVIEYPEYVHKNDFSFSDVGLIRISEIVNIYVLTDKAKEFDEEAFNQYLDEVEHRLYPDTHDNYEPEIG